MIDNDWMTGIVSNMNVKATLSYVELPVICTGAVVSCCNVDLSFFKLLVVFCLELFSYEGLVSLF